MDRTQAITFQNLYWPGIINAVQKEVKKCDSCQRTKRSNIKYGKLPAKEAEKISWKTFCRYNSSLLHKKKGKEIKLKYKIRYHYIPYNRMVQNNTI